MKRSTKLSIAAVLAAVLVLAVGWIGISMLDTRAQASPNEVVERFYNNWLEAERSESGSAVNSRLHERSTYVTPDLGRAAERATREGKDAVLCGPVASSFTTRPAAVSSTGDRASVDVNLGDRTTHAVLIRDAKGWWRIDEIDCPPTAPAATSTEATTTDAATTTAS